MSENTEKKNRVGVYVCHCGGNISDYVDTKKVVDVLIKDEDIVVAKDFIFMCSEGGQNMISDDVKENHLSHVVVASCSPRLHELTFQKVVAEAGINPFTYRHVNIREQVSWVHSHDKPSATEKAIRLIRGGVASAVKLKELSHIEKRMIQTGVVIGGGIAGMTAALDIANYGIPVHLIEKNQTLGGFLLELDTIYPSEKDSQTFVLDLVKKVQANELIIVHLNTKVVKTEGSIGEFVLTLKQNEEDRPKNLLELDVIGTDINGDNMYEIRAGTIILATGHGLYVPEQGEFGFGLSDRVITLPNLIKMLSNNNSEDLVIDGKKIRSAAFIHCVGSRQIEGVHDRSDGVLNTSCSRVCCTTTLQQINRLKTKYPKIQVYDLYRDLRTDGMKEQYYKDASNHNVIFLKYPDEEPPKIAVDKNIHVETKDELTYGMTMDLEVDLVVLAVGMVPSGKSSIITDLSLPIGDDRFLLEAHPKLKPVESATEGIFLAGTAQGPKEVRDSTKTASAAATKSIQLLKKEIVLLSPFVATVDTDACTNDQACITQCEYNAIVMGSDDTGRTFAEIIPSACTGCGACVPVCDKKAITLQGYDIERLKSEAKALIMEVAM